MKSYIKNYNIYSKKIKDSIKIVLIADLHNVFSRSEKATKSLIKDINSIEAHHISVAGDIMQGNKYTNLKVLKNLSRFLKELSESKPVFLSLGNHDLIGLTDEGFKNYKNLDKNSGVYPLYNESIIIDNFRITAFTPANEIFIKDWDSSNIPINKNSKYIEEIIGHDPFPLANKNTINNLEDLKNADLYLAGHMHDGYLPHKIIKNNLNKIKDFGITEMFVERNYEGKISKIRPWIFTKIGLCRGVHYIIDNDNILLYLNEENYIFKKNKNNYKEEDINKIVNEVVPLIITGGISKYFYFSSCAEITTINIEKERTLNVSKKVLI